MVIKSEVAPVQQSMTTFWKEERYGYNIYMKMNKISLLAGSPYTLNLQSPWVKKRL